MNFSLVIPSYNNGDILYNNIAQIVETLRKTSIIFEIIVVLDGSNDNSISEVTKLQNNFKEIRYLHYPTNSGKGAAVTVGLANARGDYIGFCDVDNSLSLESLVEMINLAIRYEKDCVIASRYKEYKNVKQPFIRKLSGYTFNKIVNFLFKLGIKDTQCGGKIFSKKAVELIINTTSIKGFSFDVEYLFTLRNNNIEILEHQVSWTHHGDYGFWKNLWVVINLGIPMLIEVFQLKGNKTKHFHWRDVLN